ncbi:MAG: hypothetical protein P8M30_11855 [Planctomycetaceae bacterium]|nr:hypothetical protein [Planctomycetaceae bacterium]MDC0308354.1 hypothetical protein [Planctomycetaceae bacterium]MDG2390005.1 hypothetical protein [Planctomycetaceae bacterium]
MIQRITLGFVAVLCACSIFGAYSILQTMNASQTLTMGLIKEVRELSEQVKSTSNDEQMKYLEWIPVTVKLEHEDGEPVTDESIQVTLSGQNLLGSNKTSSITLSPRKMGLVDFGLVKPGNMLLSVALSWGEEFKEEVVGKVGSAFELTVTCPRKKAKTGSAHLNVEWPDYFREQDIWICLDLTPAARMIHGDRWYVDLDHRSEQTRQVLIGSNGQLHSLITDANQAPFSFDAHALWLMKSFVRGDWVKSDTGLIAIISSNGGSYYGVEELRKQMLTPIKLQISDQTVTESLSVYGVDISKLLVMKRIKNNNEAATFMPILPIQLQSGFLKNEADISSPSWTYSPSDEIVDLVRYIIKNPKSLQPQMPSEGYGVN